MILNVCRLVFTIVIGLVVFAWSFAAGDEIASKPASWQGVRLEAMPELPARKTLARRARKSKLDLTPAYSQPDFGSSPKLQWTELVGVDRPSTSLPATWDERVTRYASPKSYASFADLIASRAAMTARVAPRLPIPPASLRFTSETTTSESVVGLSETTTEKPIPAESQSSKSKTVALRPAAPNFQALAKRIESHNYSVAAIEQQLEEQDQWDLESIEAAVNQVESIRRSQSLWSLYWELLDTKKRRRLRNPFTLERAADKLRERIFEVMVENQVQPEQVSTLTADDAKERLESLDRQVSAW